MSQEITVLDQGAADQLSISLVQSPEYRKKILNEILSVENQERKLRSYRQTEIYEDRMDQFVREELISMFKDPKTAAKIPNVSFVNVQKKVVSRQATLYKCAPKRTLKGASEDQLESLKEFFEDNEWNDALAEVNAMFKIQEQCTLWVAPVAGVLRPRVLANHMIDVIPHPEDPSIPMAYLVSAFDRSLTRYQNGGDGANQKIADPDDHKLEKWHVLVWTKSVNFIMNGKGAIVSPILPNPIGELPFVDVSRRKNLNFFVDGGRALADFTVKFNAAVSDAWYVVKMQGWAIGWLKGPAEMVPDSIEVGPGKFIHLPTNGQTNEELELGFSNPNSDIDGTIKFLEVLVSLFLSSQGLDAKEVSMRLEGRSFSSGFERLLAMLEIFEATEGDMNILKKAERRLFKMLVKWSMNLSNTDIQGILPPELRFQEGKDAIKVEYKKPEMVQTEGEKIDVVNSKEEKGYISKKMALKYLYNLDDEAAGAMLEDIIRDQVELELLRKEVKSSLGAEDETPEGNKPPDNPEDLKDEKAKPR